MSLEIAMHNEPVTLPEERRLVTVLFADLVGFTGRAEASDPEAVREIQRAYFGAAAGEVERYGGTVEKYIGDAVMAIFGVPQAHDDDAERALHAALGIRDAVRNLGYELEIRVGVNTGEVVGGAGSGPAAGDYTVTGDAVNIAARLQQAAASGEILVGSVTRRLASDAFEFESPAELDLKGKAEPVEAWRLVREHPQRLRLRGGQAPLVGRLREVAALLAAMDEVVRGHGLLVAVVGEAGIGKSRLALELRERAEERGYTTAWTTARSYADAFPYDLLSQLVEEFLPRPGGQSLTNALEASGIRADLETLQRWAGLLGEILGEPADEAGLAELTPTARQHALVQAMTALLTTRAARTPLLVVLDDLQWADAASLAVIDELVEALPELPVLAIGLYRPGWGHGWAAKSFYQQVNLGRLRTDETRELAGHLLGDRGPNAVPEDVLDRSGGNPFFLEELLKSAGDVAADGRTLPETVHEVVLARIDALPTLERHVLQLASVVGMEFTEPMLVAVEPEDGIADALRTLQRQDLVMVRARDPEPVFAFRHQLIHEVAYRSLLVARRRELHRRIANWLEGHGGEESLPALAAHYRESDDHDKAREYLPKAADRAAGLFAAHEALRWYLEAAELFVDDDMRRAQMLEQAAAQAFQLADMDRAIDLITQAIGLYEEAGSPIRALDAHRWLGRYYWLAGRGEESESEIARAIEGLERLPPSPELALAYSARSQVRMLMPDFEAGAAWARKAIDMAERTGATAALVHAYNNLGCSLAGLGDPAGWDYVWRSLRLALEHNMPDDAARAYVNLSGQGNEIESQPYEEMEAFFREAIAFSERMIPGGAWDQWLHNARCEFWVRTGRWDDADRDLTALARLVRAGRYVLVNVAAFRAMLAAYRGDYERAADLVRPEVEPALRIGDLQALGPIFAALSHTEAGLGNHEAAVRAIGRLIEARKARAHSDLDAWFVFEATDVVTWLAASSGSAAVDGLATVSSFAARLVPDVLRGGTPIEVAVRRSLFGAAYNQLRALARRLGVAEPTFDFEPAAFPMDADVLVSLDEAHRVFDAARVRLWLAEEHGNERLLAESRAMFERVKAAPYLHRATERVAQRLEG